jgi:hypothetical protein
MKQTLLNHLKNVYGWKTKRKIVVISVDDYGNVKLDSRQARINLDKAGLKAVKRFDKYDSMETREDLEMLFETLDSVKDKNQNAAVFTPFALPCNINFEAMAKDGYHKYIYELLPATFQKLESIDPKAYKGAWELWREGIDKGLMKPQFHGREHFNLKIFENRLKKRDANLFENLKNRSNTSSPKTEFKTIKYSAAFSFWEFKENNEFEEIIEDGLNAFEKVYGFRSTHFNPPGGRENSVIYNWLQKSGIKYLDTPLIKEEHQGKESYKKVFNYTGKKNDLGMIYQVRNVVFEPTDDRGFDWVDYAFKQVETAFFWNKPAIISSHRVNFCGHIDERNRDKGINALKALLKKIVKKWPEVEFMASNELGDLMSKKRNNV